MQIRKRPLQSSFVRLGPFSIFRVSNGILQSFGR